MPVEQWMATTARAGPNQQVHNIPENARKERIFYSGEVQVNLT
jgi:hypothetical protein